MPTEGKEEANLLADAELRPPLATRADAGPLAAVEAEVDMTALGEVPKPEAAAGRQDTVPISSFNYSLKN